MSIKDWTELTAAWLASLLCGRSRVRAPDRTNTQGLKKNSEECAAFVIISANGLMFKSPGIRTINRRPRLLHIQCYMVSRGR